VTFDAVLLVSLALMAGSAWPHRYVKVKPAMSNSGLMKYGGGQ